MAALDFPSSPSNGQLYPNPAVSGQPQYTYDGEKWTGGAGVGNVYISDSPPAAPAGSLWYESDTGMLYVRYYDGDSTQWVAIPGGPGDAVRYGAQTLTDAQQVQARKNIDAAPFDALAYNGMQINGSMEVSQENGSTIVNVPSGTQIKYIVDGWTIDKSGTSILAANQITGVAPGFVYGLQFSATTAQASIGTDYVRFRAFIEGYRILRLAWGKATAVPVTVGFWVRTTLPGTYRVQIANHPITVGTGWFPFTVNASLVWQWVTIQFPAQTSGTWATDNTAGMSLMIEVASSATPNTVSATGQYAGITGLVVLPGIEAPSAARSPLIMRPYGEELVTCQRYWQKVTSLIVETNVLCQSFVYPVQMRAAPTITGGGAGFGFAVLDNVSMLAFQTTRATQNIVFDARL